jgi:hypothetical protein
LSLQGKPICRNRIGITTLESQSLQQRPLFTGWALLPYFHPRTTGIGRVQIEQVSGRSSVFLGIVVVLVFDYGEDHGEQRIDTFGGDIHTAGIITGVEQLSKGVFLRHGLLDQLIKPVPQYLLPSFAFLFLVVTKFIHLSVFHWFQLKKI